MDEHNETADRLTLPETDPAAEAQAAGAPAANAPELARELDLLRRFLDAQTEYLGFRELVSRTRDIQTENPDFDLGQALDNPDFCRLIRGGVDPAAAWAAVFRDREAENRQRRSALDQAKNRPGENGLHAAAPARLHVDPKKLTRQERKELRRRAERGETFTFF